MPKSQHSQLLDHLILLDWMDDEWK
jgi:hypothetical protein